jgi:hypothetical protein
MSSTLPTTAINPPLRCLVVVPSYNTGSILLDTIQSILTYTQDLWVIVDGSTDHSPNLLLPLLNDHPSFQILTLPYNQGKGAAIDHAVQQAIIAGYTHILTIDADGQHPASSIPVFLEAMANHPQAALMGKPDFGPEAPAIRVQGRKISNYWAHLETLSWGISDSLFGMRLYPIQAINQAFKSTRWARRFDFDTEIAVRIAWLGIPMHTISTPVRYISKEEGGVSQFRYGRDNLVLTWMHTRLVIEFLFRLPHLLYRKLTLKLRSK